MSYKKQDRSERGDHCSFAYNLGKLCRLTQVMTLEVALNDDPAPWVGLTRGISSSSSNSSSTTFSFSSPSRLRMQVSIVEAAARLAVFLERPVPANNRFFSINLIELLCPTLEFLTTTTVAGFMVEFKRAVKKGKPQLPAGTQNTCSHMAREEASMGWT